MTIQSFVLDNTTVLGAPIGPVNGYLVNLTGISPPNINGRGPGYGRTRGYFLTGLIHLQGEFDPRPILFVDTNDQEIPAGQNDTKFYTNANIRYAGQFVIHSLPANAVYNLDLSDIPV